MIKLFEQNLQHVLSEQKKILSVCFSKEQTAHCLLTTLCIATQSGSKKEKLRDTDFRTKIEWYYFIYSKAHPVVLICKTSCVWLDFCILSIKRALYRDTLFIGNTCSDFWYVNSILGFLLAKYFHLKYWITQSYPKLDKMNDNYENMLIWLALTKIVPVLEE